MSIIQLKYLLTILLWVSEYSLLLMFVAVLVGVAIDVLIFPIATAIIFILLMCTRTYVYRSQTNWKERIHRAYDCGDIDLST